MSQVFGDPKRLVNDYMAASHAIGITVLHHNADAFTHIGTTCLNVLSTSEEGYRVTEHFPVDEVNGVLPLIRPKELDAEEQLPQGLRFPLIPLNSPLQLDREECAT